MTGSWQSPPAARRIVTVAVCCVGLVMLDVWLGVTGDQRPRPLLVSDVALGVCFVVAGIAAWRLRPRSRIGVLMLVLGVVMLLANPYGYDLAPGTPGASAIGLVGVPIYWLQFALASHLFLSYPTGRLSISSIEGRFVAFCYAHVVVTSLAVPVAGARRVDGVVMAVWIVLAVVALGLLVRRLLRSTPRRRNREGLALTAAGTAVILFAAVFLTTLARSGGAADVHAASTLHTWMAWTGVIAVPIAYLLGLLRERLAFASVGDLVRRLESVGSDAIEPTLAQTLNDPKIRVAFPTESGLVDVSGHHFDPPVDDTVARMPLGDPPYAVLLHDRALADDRELLDAAVAAAGLALDNARLHARVRAQLAEVTASRQRIARAADVERQRLERDLHDGAQQHLLAIGYMLGALGTRLTAPAERQLVCELEAELRGAIGELREFAQGIRPAVLTDQGLDPALASLARRAGISVRLYTAKLGPRLTPIIEATAYYVVSEALHNVVRHTQDARATVTVTRRENLLLVEIVDDGPGGASIAAGSGLRSVADRVGAIGGQVEIDSPAGGGTRVAATLPCS